MLNAPCLKCQERKIGCHGTCEKYIAWRAGMDEEARRKRLAKLGDEAAFMAVLRTKRRYCWNKLRHWQK